MNIYLPVFSASTSRPTSY